MDKQINFTKTRLLEIQPSSKRQVFYDKKTPYLALRVFPSGNKTFCVIRKINGKSENIRLGSFPTMTVEQARKKMAEINSAIVNDQNPAAARRAIKAEPTFQEVFDDYIRLKRNRRGKGLSDRTVDDYQALMRNHLSSVATMRISQVTIERVKKIDITSDAQNNRARAVIGAVFNWAIEEGITKADNPCKGIKFRHIESRDRFLQPDELPNYIMAAESNLWSNVWSILLYTGQRRSNVFSMKWNDIDLNQGVWKLHHLSTKNGDPLTVVLPPEAVSILRARRNDKIVSPVWVFPSSRSKTGHVVAPAKQWAKVLRTAGLSENLRIHDLRRTLGSWQARAGASLTIVGKSLGHKSQQATAIYARVDLDPVRQSVEGAVSSLLKASKK